MLTIPSIRPALQSLRQMPTLHEVSEIWGKLELKLETTDTRYWLTTQGVPQKTTGTPINYVIDYVTVEKLTEDGRWDLRAVYSPDAWRLSQGFDYRQMLHREIIELTEELEQHFRWEKKRELDELHRELDVTNRAIAILAEKVRQRWAN
jgi:hypothetical protein